MTGFDAWRISTTIKMHFESEGYDAFRFCFKAKNLTPRTFESRRDRYFFEKLAKNLREEDQIRRYAFANIFFQQNTWVGAMVEQPYKEYCKRIQTFSYRFKQDLNRLPQASLDELLIPANGNIPVLIKRYLEGDLMAETAAAVNALTNFVSRIDKKVTDVLLWPEVRLRLIKATPFISRDVDVNKVKKILVDHFTSLQNT